MISIEISISTPKKYQSRRSRKSRQFQKVSLDDRDISIEISRFCLDTSEKSGKSRSRPRNLSRHDIFGKSRQFFSISIESWSMLSRFSIEISQFVEISEPEVSNKSWKSLDYVEKSRKFSTNLESLDLSRRSRFVSTISINISTKINLDRKISILKSWSRPLRTFSISIGLDVETTRLNFIIFKLNIILGYC